MDYSKYLILVLSFSIPSLCWLSSAGETREQIVKRHILASRRTSQEETVMRRILTKRRKPLERWEIYPGTKLPRPSSSLIVGLSHEDFYLNSPNKLLPRAWSEDADLSNPDADDWAQFKPPAWQKPMEELATQICRRTRQNDLKGFLALCLPGNEKRARAKELFESCKKGFMYWLEEGASAVARNRIDKNLIAVTVRDDGAETLEGREFDNYRKLYGMDWKAWCHSGIGSGIQYTLYFRYVDKIKLWRLDPSYCDPKLDELLRNELYYPRDDIKSEVWRSDPANKGKAVYSQYYNDYSKPFDYRKWYRKNGIFTLDQAMKLEKEIRILRKPKPELTNRERFILGHSPNPYSFDQFVKGVNWEKKYTRKEMEAFRKQINKINEENYYIYTAYGKEALRIFLSRYNMHVFKKPISFTNFSVDHLDLAKDRRNSLLDLVLVDITRDYFGVRDRAKYDELMKFSGKWEPSRKQDLGMNVFQLHCYQTVKFAGVETVYLKGMFVNGDTLDNKLDWMYFEYAYDKEKGEWDKVGKYKVELHMASLICYRSLNYEYFLDAVYRESKIPGLEYFNKDEVTSKQYHDRLKKLKIYDLFRFRKLNECTPYTPGMDHTKVPTITLEDIEKSK